MWQTYPNIQKLIERVGSPLVIFDTETTNLLGKREFAVIEIAAIVLGRSGIQESVQFLIDPGIRIPEEAKKIHGIGDEDVRGCRTLAEWHPTVFGLLNGRVACGFNVRTFDIPGIYADCKRYDLDLPEFSGCLDVRDFWIKVSGAQKGKLTEVAAKYGIRPQVAHRAMADTLTTAATLEAMLQQHGLQMALSVMRKGTTVRDESATYRAAPSSMNAARASALDRLKQSVAHTSQSVASSASKMSPDVPPPYSRHAARDGGHTLNGVLGAQTQKNQLKAQIKRYAFTHGRVLASDMEKIAAVAGVKTASVSFALSEMLESGEIEIARLIDDEAQQNISRYLERAIRMAGGEDRLKPIKEALEFLSKGSVDYIQLRIALKIREMLICREEDASCHAPRP